MYATLRFGRFHSQNEYFRFFSNHAMYILAPFQHRTLKDILSIYIQSKFEVSSFHVAVSVGDIPKNAHSPCIGGRFERVRNA